MNKFSKNLGNILLWLNAAIAGILLEYSIYIGNVTAICFFTIIFLGSLAFALITIPVKKPPQNLDDYQKAVNIQQNRKFKLVKGNKDENDR